MEVVYIAGLSGIVESHRVIPVSGIDDDLERPAAGLVVAAPGGRHRVAVAAARQGANVVFRTQLRLEGGAQRVRNGCMVISAQLPLLLVRPKALGELCDGLVETLREQGIAAADGIRT